MKKKTGACVVLGALMALTPTAGAQAPDTATLTLDQALSLGLGSNPAYRRAVNSALLNGTEMRTVWFDQVLPQAQLNLFQTQFTGNLTRIATDNFGNPIENPISDWNYFSQTNQSLDLTWRIQGASIFNALDRQKLTNLDRDVAEVRARMTLGVDVRRAFMDVIEQRDLLRAEEELLEGRELDREAAQRLFRLAMRTRVDVLNADLAVQQQALALRQQRAAFEKARLTLRTQLGDDELGPFRVAETPLPIFDPSMLDGDALVTRALDVNPELRRSRVAVRTANVGVSEAKRAWWPAVFLNFNISRRAQTPQADALFDLSFNEDLDQRFYIGLQVPMFSDYFSNTQGIQQAKVELQNSREAEREAKMRVEESVRAALLELANQYESLRLAERSAEIAGEALTLAREEYRLGTRTFEDLRQSIDQEADTRRQVITARHLFVDALLVLEEAVGAPVAPDASAGVGGR
jgi:outer membrane protein TolC